MISRPHVIVGAPVCATGACAGNAAVSGLYSGGADVGGRVWSAVTADRG